MNSRDAFRKTMQAANPERPVFVPIVYRLAARIEQTPLLDMVSDATAYANVLDGAWKLLRQDAIVTNFDATLEAEAFGGGVEWGGDYDPPVVNDWSACDPAAAGLESGGRVPVMLEAMKRLVQTRGREVAIVGVMTGPCSLARLIADNTGRAGIEEIITAAGGQLTRLTRAIGEIKVDAIIFREDLLAEKFYEELLAREKAAAAVYATLFNLTRFYNIAGLVMVRNQKLEDVAALGKKLAPSGLILSGQRLTEADLIFLKDLSASLKMAIGVPLPLENADETMARFRMVDDFVNKYNPGGFFYTSDGEVPPDMPLELIRDIAGRIKSISAS